MFLLGNNPWEEHPMGGDIVESIIFQKVINKQITTHRKNKIKYSFIV